MLICGRFGAPHWNSTHVRRLQQSLKKQPAGLRQSTRELYHSRMVPRANVNAFRVELEWELGHCPSSSPFLLEA